MSEKLPPLPGQTFYDCRYWGVLEHEPFSQDWMSITSDLLYDQTVVDEFGQLVFLDADKRFMWIQIDCRKCTGDTNIKLVGAVGPFDSLIGTFTVPAGDVFTWGENGAKGAGGRGVRAISLTLENGMAIDEKVPMLIAFDDD